MLGAKEESIVVDMSVVDKGRVERLSRLERSVLDDRRKELYGAMLEFSVTEWMHLANTSDKSYNVVCRQLLDRHGVSRVADPDLDAATYEDVRAAIDLKTAREA